MKKFLIYLVVLFTSAVIVFFLVYTLGRQPSLEQELARRTTYRRPEPRSLTIPSLKPEEPEEVEEIEVLPPPRVSRLNHDVTVTRYPQEEAAMVLLLDPGILSPGAGRGYPPLGRFRGGLEGFFRRLPANVGTGLRSLAGVMEGDCTGTVQLKGPGAWPAGELAQVLQGASAEGPRSISVGLGEAAADLAQVRGEKAVVIVTGGDEECGGAPCQVAAALQESPQPVRTFIVVLRPPRSASPYGDLPPPAWQSRMECMTERGGGVLYEATSGGELEEILLEIASTLQPNLTVRVLHAAEREVKGVNVETRDAWGAAVLPTGGPAEEKQAGNRLPAVFSLPSGDYDLEIWYRGQERHLRGLPLSSRERVEVQANFRAGELYVQPRDDAGEELVGDTAGFDCFWGVEIFHRDDLTRDYGAACSFPAYFVLEPGSYTIRIWNGEEEAWVEEVAVKEGETTVESVVFTARE